MYSQTRRHSNPPPPPEKKKTHLGAHLSIQKEAYACTQSPVKCEVPKFPVSETLSYSSIPLAERWPAPHLTLLVDSWQSAISSRTNSMGLARCRFRWCNRSRIMVMTPFGSRARETEERSPLPTASTARNDSCVQGPRSRPTVARASTSPGLCDERRSQSEAARSRASDAVERRLRPCVAHSDLPSPSAVSGDDTTTAPLPFSGDGDAGQVSFFADLLPFFRSPSGITLPREAASFRTQPPRTQL